MYADASLELASQHLASLGIHHVELWQVEGWCEHLAGGPEGAAETLAMEDLAVFALAAYRSPSTELGPYLSDLDRLGGRVLVTEPPPPDVSVDSFAEDLRPMVERAIANDLLIGVENHVDSSVESIEEMVRFLDLLPSEGVGITLAPTHLYRIGESIPGAIRTLGDRIAFCYARDWRSRTDPHENPADQFVGNGVIDFRSMARALLDVGYDRPLNVFAHGTDSWSVNRRTKALSDAIETLDRAIASVKA